MQYNVFGFKHGFNEIAQFLSKSEVLVSLFKSYFFPPIIILFLQYSHKRSSHVSEIWPIQGLMFNILLIQILTFLSPLPHVRLPFTKRTCCTMILKRMQLTSLEWNIEHQTLYGSNFRSMGAPFMQFMLCLYNRLWKESLNIDGRRSMQPLRRAHQTRRSGQLLRLGFNEIAQFLSKSNIN
jgi:hypothetical protein